VAPRRTSLIKAKRVAAQYLASAFPQHMQLGTE